MLVVFAAYSLVQFITKKKEFTQVRNSRPKRIFLEIRELGLINI